MAARRLHEIEQEIHDEAERRSRKILATTIQRIATDYVAESTVSVVPLPSDEMKGRIIGREGRNIRALEQATGVDLIVDDTPEVDHRLRATTRSAANWRGARCKKLLQDGRIHPTRIEEVVDKTQPELEQVIREEGEKVAYEANVVGLHPDLIKLLGRLKFRTSYGQNVLAHSLEVSMIAGGAGRRNRRRHQRLQDGRPAARHRQGGRPRSRGSARPDRRGYRPAARPFGQDRARDRRAPR